MAERRMFSKTITQSDVFQELPVTTRLLYFELGMQADDDGFVNNAKRAALVIGAKEKDLKNLVDVGLLIKCNNYVYAITHWRINNQIRKDRHKPTIYQNELEQLKNSGQYIISLSKEDVKDVGNQMETIGLPNSNQMETQSSLGEASKEKESQGEASKEKASLAQYSLAETETGQTDDNFSFSGSSDSSSSAYPLTVGEVRTFCQDMGAYTDPVRFFEYYQERNWTLDDGKPVRDWKRLALSKTWNIKETTPEKPKEQPKQEEIEKLAKEIIFSGNPIPPKDLEEVKEYCDGWNDFSPEEFYNYFEDKFWKLFDKPVINWKMAVKLWRREILENGKFLKPEEIAKNIREGRGGFTIWDKEEAWTDFKNGTLNLDQQLKDAGKLSSFGCPCPLGMTMEMFEEYYRKMKD